MAENVGGTWLFKLLPRLESIEWTGAPGYVATIFVGGLKHLPIRYAVTG